MLGAAIGGGLGQQFSTSMMAAGIVIGAILGAAAILFIRRYQASRK